MKKVLLILCFLSMGAQAVQVADCPKSIALEIQDFSFDYVFPEQLDTRNCIYDCYNEVGMSALQKELTAAKSVSLDLQLARTSAGVCHYEVAPREGTGAQARIQGSFKKDAKEKAALVTFWQGGAFYTPLKSMQPKVIEAASSTTGLYYVGEYCSYGDCGIDHIKIGRADSTRLEVLY